MAEVSTVLKGALEDHLGRVLHPDSEADQILCEDGKSVETRLAELLAAFAGYLPLNGGGTVNGAIKINNGKLEINKWGVVSTGSDGFVLIAQNAYKDPVKNTYHYAHTHENVGARGIEFKHGQPGVWWFDQGMIPTTEGQEFAPSFRSMTNPDAALISGQDLDSLTQNGTFCGNTMTNTPFASSDWFWVFVNNLTNNSANYVTQTAVAVNQEAIYTRTRRNGVWGAWARVATISSDGSSAFVPIPRYGPESARGGYLGYPDGGTMLYLTNETGGAINLSSTGGVQINGQRIPAQFYSTNPPSSSDGQDGDVWDVYV